MIFFVAKLNGKIFGIAADRIGGVERSGGIDEKSGAGKFAVRVNRVNLDDRFAAALEERLHFAADGAGGIVLRRQRRCKKQTHDGEQAGENLSASEKKSGTQRAPKN